LENLKRKVRPRDGYESQMEKFSAVKRAKIQQIYNSYTDFVDFSLNSV